MNESANKNHHDMWLQSNIFDYCNESETLYLLLELRFLKDILPEQYKQELKKEY